MQTTRKKVSKRNIFKNVLSLTIVILCTIAAVLSVTGNAKFEKLLLASCNSVKKGIESIDIPTGNWQCRKRQIYADFHIDSPFEKAKKGKFWQGKPENQWLMWGATSEPEDDFTINVKWKDDPDQFTGNLRRSLRTIKRLRVGKIRVSVSYKSIDVHGGTFEVLPFVYRDQTLLKQCLGFTNKQRDDRVLVRGWLCAKPQSTPSIEKLECLLSSLAIDGIIKQDRSINWCSSFEQQVQS
ncbi:MAG: hypothetical protein COA78_14295 [Blastopirellula sp.]|nr:MAG: hypothetical protein COA78_14295 [Blastopirellula sp.]